MGSLRVRMSAQKDISMLDTLLFLSINIDCKYSTRNTIVVFVTYFAKTNRMEIFYYLLLLSCNQRDTNQEKIKNRYNNNMDDVEQFSNYQ